MTEGEERGQKEEGRGQKEELSETVFHDERRDTLAAIRSFRELRVYQAARASAKEIFQISRRFPADERYSLTDQIRRASRSVQANIAEAWRKRRYPNSFVSKLSDADAESAEVGSWLDSAIDCGYISQAEHKRIDAQYSHIGAQLWLMMDEPEKWCGQKEDEKPRSRR